MQFRSPPGFQPVFNSLPGNPCFKPPTAAGVKSLGGERVGKRRGIKPCQKLENEKWSTLYQLQSGD